MPGMTASATSVAMPSSVMILSRSSAGASSVMATAPPPITGCPLGVVSRLKRSVVSGSVSTRRFIRSRPPNRKNTTTLSSVLKISEERNSSVGLPARSLRSTTPLTIEPKMLIGEKPPAVAPLMTIRPISTGLILNLHREAERDRRDDRHRRRDDRADRGQHGR